MTVFGNGEQSKPEPLPDHRIYEFCPADNAIFPRCMIHYYYRNADNSPDFMDFVTLKTTFYDALSICLPMTLGSQVHMESPPFGKLTISADTKNPRWPPVTKHIDHEHTVAEMIACGFVVPSQPSVLAKAPLLANPLEGDPLVSLDLVYMADGVGLLLAISHSIVDLVSFQNFIGEWSSLNRSSVSRSARYLPKQLYSDRPSFWDAVLKYPEPGPSDIDRHLQTLAAEAQASVNTSAAKEPPAPLDPVASDFGVYRIEVSPTSIEELSLLKSQVCPEVTVPNLIAAVLWKSISLVHQSSPYTYFANSLSIRKLPEFADFCGNTATMKYMYQKTATLASQNVFQVSQQIQRSSRSFTAGEFARIVSGYTEPESTYSRDLARFVENNRMPRLMVTNVSRIPFYNADFGYGAPTKLLFPSEIPPGLCAFTPMSKEGGIDILICTTDNAIENIKNDQLLGSRIVVYRHDMV